MKTKHGFGLQHITIDLAGPEEIPGLEQQVRGALESYHWIYRNEIAHDIMCTIVLPLRFEPPPSKEEN